MGLTTVIRRVTSQKNEVLIDAEEEILSYKPFIGNYSNSLFCRVLGLSGSEVQPCERIEVSQTSSVFYL